jgi:dephospho-CoA kinase
LKMGKIKIPFSTLFYVKYMAKPKIIGITGGIGSGKSIVCKIFMVLGIPVFNADTEAKRLVVEDAQLKQEIIVLLGTEAYIEGKYNRSFVASKIFNNPDLLLKLNNKIHPAVREYANKWAEKQKNAPYLLYEAALMNAAGDGNNFDKIIIVNAPLKLRIDRVKARDNRTNEEITAIISKQKTDKERQQITDFTIENNEKASLINQVLAIHHDILAIITK